MNPNDLQDKCTNAQFEYNNGLTICTNRFVIYYKPPSLERAAVIKGGPFIFATTFCGVIATVTNSNVAPYTPDHLCIYQIGTGIFIKQIQFQSPIIGLHSTQTHLFICLKDIIKVLDARNHQTISAIERHSLSDVFAASLHFCAWSDEAHLGHVFVASIPEFSVIHNIPSHENQIRSIAISQDSTLLFTASTRGTVIRSYTIENGIKIREYRRGILPGTITSIDSKNGLLCICSLSTVHLFYGEKGHIGIHPDGVPISCKFIENFLCVITDKAILSSYSYDFTTGTAELNYSKKLLSEINSSRKQRRTTV